MRLTDEDQLQYEMIRRHIYFDPQLSDKRQSVVDRIRDWLIEKLAGRRSYVINAQFNLGGWPLTVRRPFSLMHCDLYDIDEPYIRVLGPFPGGATVERASPAEIAATKEG